MPIVPATRLPSVAPAPLPGVRVSPEAPLEAFGGGAANRQIDLAPVTELARNIFEDEKRKADQTAVLAAAGKASELETALTIRTKQRKGQDAFAAPDEVADEWTKATGDIEKSLTTDTQRQAFAQIKSSHWRELNAAVQTHVAAERQQYDAQVTDTYLASERNAAIENYADPARVALAVENQQAAITDHLNRIYNRQIPPGLLEQQKAGAASATFVGVIDRMLANENDLQAKAYYDRVKDQIQGEARTKIEQALEAGSARAESQRRADTILARSKSLGDAMQEVRGIQDAKVRDMTEDRVKRDFAERAADKRATDEARMQEATNIIERTRDFTKIPPSMLVNLSIEERKSLRDYAEKLQDPYANINTDWPTYYMLKSLASAEGTRDKFLTTNLLAYRSRLSNADFKSLIDTQASLRNGEVTHDAELGHYRTQEQVIRGSLVQAGVVGAGAKADDPKIVAFTREFEAERSALEASTKRKTTTAEMQQIADRLLIQGVTDKGWLWDTTKRAFELMPGETLTLRFKDVPAVAAAQIRAQLKAHGLPGTDEQVLDVYRTKLAKRVNYVAP